MDIVDKIDMISLTREEQNDIHQLLEMAVFMDEANPEMLNEAITDTIKNVGKKIDKALGSLGLHAHKGSEGLIQVALKAGKDVAAFIWYALRAATGDAEAKDRLRELAGKEITKEQILDVLLKLDMLTLHAITGPIHMIDALTGWHIWTQIRKKTEPAIQKAKQALENLKELARTAEEKAKKQIIKYAHSIARLFGLESEHKAIRSL